MKPSLTDTSDSGHLTYMATLSVLIEEPLIQYLRILPNADALLFLEADRFFSPFSTWTVRNSFNNMNTCMSPAQDCLAPLIDSTTGQYNSTVTHSTSLLLAFLNSIKQGRAPECAFIVLNGTSTHCHGYWKYTRTLQSRITSLLRWHQWYRGSTVVS